MSCYKIRSFLHENVLHLHFFPVDDILKKIIKKRQKSVFRRLQRNEIEKYPFWHRDGFLRCPELFKLQDKWVIFGADGRYQIGDFDGHVFEPETLPRPLFTGNAYAAQTFSNADRRILIAWMRSNSGLYADLPFCQQMTLPCELTLDGDALRINPAVDVPREIISSPDRETVVEGIAVPPAEHIEIVRDTMSVEIFVNHGERYFVKALPPR